MDSFSQERSNLVNLLRKEGISSERVLAAIAKVPRHLFVPLEMQPFAYQDRPLEIGHAQTISQPYIVAYMTEVAGVNAESKVLEIGTGSGYQAAILAEICAEVYSVEIIEELGLKAKKLMQELDYKNFHSKIADGYYAWQEHAPFDAIIVTAAASRVPEELIKQLLPSGCIIIPLQNDNGEECLTKVTSQFPYRVELLPVRFVPMTGVVQGYPDIN